MAQTGCAAADAEQEGLPATVCAVAPAGGQLAHLLAKRPPVVEGWRGATLGVHGPVERSCTSVAGAVRQPCGHGRGGWWWVVGWVVCGVWGAQGACPSLAHDLWRRSMTFHISLLMPGLLQQR